MARSSTSYSLWELLGDGIVVFDGAMGTELLRRTGNFLPCEGLNLSHPELVESIYRAYLQAGAQVIRTNSFGANRIVLERYQLGDQTTALNRAAVEIAHRAVRDVSHGRSVLVAGSIGPIPHSATESSKAAFSQRAAYAEQATALLEAGAEMLICETFQRIEDIAQVLMAVMPAAREAGRNTLVAVCLTPSDDSEQAANSAASIYEAVIRDSGVDFFGFNCGTGPKSIARSITILKPQVNLPLVALPSAGIPTVEGKSPCYPVGIAEFTEMLCTLVDRGLVAAVGGCCGTTPAYIAALVKEVGGPTAN